MLNNRFFKSVVVLMSGSIVSQAIPIAIMPILTRIYSPDDFGLLSLYLSILSSLAVVGTFRYELAIVLPESRQDAKNLFFLCNIITLAVTVILMLLVIVFSHNIALFFDNPSLEVWLFLIPVSFLLTGFCQSLNYWSLRESRYSCIAKSKVYLAVMSSVTSVSGGYVNNGSVKWLFLSNAIGLVTAYLNLLSKNKKYYTIKGEFGINATQMYRLACKYKKMPIFNMPNAFLETLRITVLNIFITRIFDIFILGQLSLAWRMIQVPTRIIGLSISQVFVKSISQATSEEMYILSRNFVLYSACIGLPLFTLIYFLAPNIFVIVFGDAWDIAGHSASAMVPWLFTVFIMSPLSSVYVVTGRQEVVLLFTMISLVVLVAILIFYDELSYLSLISIISNAMAICFVIFIFITLLFLQRLKDRV